MTDPLRTAFERIFMRQLAFRSTVCRDNPMGAARIVRRERHVWPGGYLLVLVMDDGEVLCPDCVASEFSQISHSHRHDIKDGWKPVGMMILEESPDGDTMCAHCNKVLMEQDD
jgi:hypothetical protein